MPPATAGTSAARAREHLLRLLAPVVAEAGYDLEDVTVSAAGRRKLVRLVVDADGGIDLDAVAEVSRTVSETLDADPATEAVLAGAYVLEVSSPGVDRPLVEPRHWRRARGRLVAVDGAASFTGRVLDTDDAGVTFATDAGSRRVAWPDLGRGKVQIEFNRADPTDEPTDEGEEE